MGITNYTALKQGNDQKILTRGTIYSLQYEQRQFSLWILCEIFMWLVEKTMAGFVWLGVSFGSVYGEAWKNKEEKNDGDIKWAKLGPDTETPRFGFYSVDE